MQITIKRIVPDDNLTTFASIIIHAEIYNSQSNDLVLDGFKKRIFFEIQSLSYEKLLEIDESLRLKMLYSKGLRNQSPPLTISGLTSKIFTFDLAQYYFPFAQGEYRIIPHLEIDGEPPISGPAVLISINAMYAEQIVTWFQDPIFGSDSFFCRLKGLGGIERSYLKWLGLNNPLASFHNTELGQTFNCIAAYPCLPSFKQLDKFEPGFEKQIIWYHVDHSITITRYFDGIIQGVPGKVSLGIRLDKIVGASYTMDLMTYVFGIEQKDSFSKHIVGLKIDTSGNVQRFFSAPLLESNSLVQVQCIFDYIIVIEAGRSVQKTIYSVKNEVLEKSQLGNLSGKPIYLFLSVMADIVRVAYLKDAKIISVFESNVFPLEDTKEPLTAEIGIALESGAFCEKGVFVFDFAQKLHFLYMTSSRRLIYRSPEPHFYRIAKSKQDFWPDLMAGDRESNIPFVGFYTEKTGYRYYSAAQDFLSAGVKSIII